MTIGTEPLTPEATWHEVEAIVDFLTLLGVRRVEITYGWGCHTEGIQQPIDIPLTEVIDLLHKGIAQAIYHLGEDNLYIVASEPSLKVTLCHDADIHFEASETGLEARLRDEWEARGHRIWQSKDIANRP